MSRALSVEDALRLILDSVSPRSTIVAPLLEAAGLVLAERIVAVDDVPYRDNSGMDGFAVRSRELDAATEEDPVALRLVAGVIAAGPGRPAGLTHGTTARIMTGALIPPGADAVVPVEEVEVQKAATHEHVVEVFFRRPVAPGRHVRPAGEDLRAGAVALPPGTVMTPGAIGVAAVAGRARVTVHRRPRLAILTSGDEIVAPDALLQPGQVRNANSLVLAATLSEAGAEIVDLGVAPDDRLAIAEALTMARRADAVVTSGGVSMGERDYLRSVLGELGFKEKFWKVDFKPGHPLLFGMLGETPVFGLPGNPVSAAVTAEIFVRPAIRKMLGHARLFRPIVTVVVAEEIRRRAGRPELIRVVVERSGRGLVARPTRAEQGSGILTSLVNANGLVYLDASRDLVKAGESRPCVILEEPAAETFTLG